MQAFIRETIKACQEIVEMLEVTTDPEAFKAQKIGAGGDESVGLDLMAEEIFVRRLPTMPENPRIPRYNTRNPSNRKPVNFNCKKLFF